MSTVDEQAMTPAISTLPGKPSADTVGGRTRLPGISARAYEHPADRAALTALRKIPGFDLLLRKLIGVVGERRLRYWYLGSAVRVTQGQFTEVHALYDECLAILDIQEAPELYVAQTPIVNAGAVGADKPFIVLNSATLDLFTEDELRLIIGHELGHIQSGHVLYKTMLVMLLQLSLRANVFPLGTLALYGIIAGLREWDRKSELSSDRAGLLCVQDPTVAYTVHMKMAGGSKTSQMSVDEFMRQAEDYEAGGDVLDSAMKILNLLWQRHPFHVIRLAELKRWVDAGGYEDVLSGNYPRRHEDSSASVVDEATEGAKSYKDSFDHSKDPLLSFIRDVGQAGSSALGRAKDFFSPKS